VNLAQGADRSLSTCPLVRWVTKDCGKLTKVTGKDDAAQRLQRGIETRQKELQDTEEFVAKAASGLGRRAAITKIITIGGGALVATRELATRIWGSGSTTIAVIYTLVGVAISTAAAMEAAFRWDSRSGALTGAASAVRTATRRADSLWKRSVPSARLQGADAEVSALQSVLDLQDVGLDAAHDRAAAHGINISAALTSRSDFSWKVITTTQSEDEDPRRSDYPA
jgi:hypothetical protein